MNNTLEISETDYDTLEGVRNSELSAAGRGYYYWYAYRHRSEKTEAQALTDGRMAHLRLLEPEAYATALHTLTPKKQANIIRWTDKAKEANRQAGINLPEYLTEYVYRWEMEGQLCKAKTDCIDTANNRIIDYKFMRDWGENPDKGRRALIRYHYHKQAAFYLDGAIAAGVLEPGATFTLVVISKAKEPQILIETATRTMIETGRRLYKYQIQQYLKHLQFLNNQTK